MAASAAAADADCARAAAEARVGGFVPAASHLCTAV